MSEAGSLADGSAALSAASEAGTSPSWVLLDLMLPDGSGVELVRRVRRECAATRVCVISGCAPEITDAARRAGADHVLTKPLDVKRLVAVLSQGRTAGPG